MDVHTINYHLKKVFSYSELQKDSGNRNFRITDADDKSYTTQHYKLPPLPEQHRTVIRIDPLMALCDTLGQQIDVTTGKQTKLLNAVMAAV